MEMGKKQNHLQAIQVREGICETVFTSWVSEQRVGGVLDALGDMLWWLDGIASCRWGCRKGDHEEEHLLGRFAATASAAYILLKRGYLDQASGVFRQLAETTSLLDLFGHSRKDYQEWRTSNERVRKRRYSALNVRLKLESLGVDPVMGGDSYQLLSQYGVHPGPGTEPRTHDSPGEPSVGTAYRPAAGFALAAAVASAVVRALIFGSDIISHPDAKQDALTTAAAANEELRGIDLEALKEEATLVLQPPRIEVTVEPTETPS